MQVTDSIRINEKKKIRCLQNEAIMVELWQTLSSLTKWPFCLTNFLKRCSRGQIGVLLSPPCVILLKKGPIFQPTWLKKKKHRVTQLPWVNRNVLRSLYILFIIIAVMEWNIWIKWSVDCGVKEIYRNYKPKAQRWQQAFSWILERVLFTHRSFYSYLKHVNNLILDQKGHCSTYFLFSLTIRSQIPLNCR